jgi:hypothetical protein
MSFRSQNGIVSAVTAISSEIPGGHSKECLTNRSRDYTGALQMMGACLSKYYWVDMLFLLVCEIGSIAKISWTPCIIEGKQKLDKIRFSKEISESSTHGQQKNENFDR